MCCHRLTKNNIIFMIPKQLLLQANPNSYSPVTPSAPGDTEYQHEVDLSREVLYQAQTAHGHFEPYLGVLENQNLPTLSVSDSEMALLGSSLSRSGFDLVRTRYHSMRRWVCPSTVRQPHDRCEWALGVVGSRAFWVHERLSMVPLVDMINRNVTENAEVGLGI